MEENTAGRTGKQRTGERDQEVGEEKRRQEGAQSHREGHKEVMKARKRQERTVRKQGVSEGKSGEQTETSR